MNNSNLRTKPRNWNRDMPDDVALIPTSGGGWAVEIMCGEKPLVGEDWRKLGVYGSYKAARKAAARAIA